jgi:hypothetical protein
MKVITDISENEVVAEFLRAEINSKRWRDKIKEILNNYNSDRNIIDSPNLNDNRENEIRKNVLGEFRGFGRNTSIFTNFPNNIKWVKSLLNKEDLEKAKYIDYSYWLELSKGTRLVKDGAAGVKEGLTPFDVANDNYFGVHEAIKEGKKLPYMIFVAKNENDALVVLEGHTRLTAYFLDPLLIPSELEAIVGFSEELPSWVLY